MQNSTKLVASVLANPTVSKSLKMADLIAKVGVSFVPGGSGIYGASKLALEKVSGYVQASNERRILDFHRHLLYRPDGLEEELSDAEVEEAHYHALLNACISDIEEEKTSAYAHLTRTIAKGNVPQNYRRHFIVSLKDLAWEQLDFLRRLYVTTKFEVMPKNGAGNVETSSFLTDYEPGSIEHLSVVAISAKGFVNETELSQLGITFIEACSRSEDLSPELFGYKVWSVNRCAIICLDSMDIASTLELSLRTHRFKAGGIILDGALTSRAEPPRSDCIILVVRNGATLDSDKLQNLKRLISKKTVIQMLIEDSVDGDGESPISAPTVKISRDKLYEGISETIKLLKQELATR